jgi:hypothetical protein
VNGQMQLIMMVGERKLDVKNPMKGQTTLCQDSLMNWAINHNKIGQKMNSKVPLRTKTTTTSVWCIVETTKNTKKKRSNGKKKTARAENGSLIEA